MGKHTKPKPSQDVIDAWPDGAAVAAMGSTARTISRWVESGVVRREKASDGTWRYDPESVEAAVSARGAPGNQARDELLDTLRSVLAMMVTHTERSFELTHAPGLRLLELLQKENERLAGRCTVLEDRHLKFLETFETLMTAQHERELATTLLEQQEARRDKAFQKLTDAAPGFLSQVLASFAGKSLLDSIDDDQLTVLCIAEFLTPAQRSTLLAEQKRREAKKTKAAPSSSSSAAADQPAPNGAAPEDKHG